MKAREKGWYHLASMSWSRKLPGNLRFETWSQLVLSRFTYAKHIAASYSTQMFKELQQFYYRSIKNLLNVKTKIETQKFLTLVMGMTFAQYQQAAVTSMRSNVPADDKLSASIKLREAMNSIRKWAELKSPDLLKWKLLIMFPHCHAQEDQKLVCICKATLTDRHISLCKPIQEAISKLSPPVTFQQLQEWAQVNIAETDTNQLNRLNNALKQVKGKLKEKLAVKAG